MRPGFDAPTVIRTKRDGGRLSDAAIDWVIDAYTGGLVAEEQMAALLMAILLRGMDGGETAAWTSAMLASGDRLDFSDLGVPTVDKHSTGGVGDKITLPLVPVVAACGAAVPQASGRGLGHTGGTLDKLDAIAGFSAQLPAGGCVSSCARSGRPSSPPVTWPRPTPSCTRCATSPPPWNRCR